MTQINQSSGKAAPIGQVVLTDRQWADLVAAKSGHNQDGSQVDRVESALAEADVRPGRPPASAHRLHVAAVYFAGVKVVRKPDVDGGTGITGGEPLTGTVVEHEITRAPFAFHHEFGPGLTAFATDGVNLAGKSTILGVLLWALRGEVPSPTLQPDVVKKWLREAAVVFTLDNATILVYWRIDGGRPEGGVYDVLSPDELDLSLLTSAALQSGGEELAASEAVASSEDEDARDDRGPNAAASVEWPMSWPGEALIHGLLSNDLIRSLATFETEDMFEAAMSGVLMPRLDLEPVKVWQKMPGATDRNDAKMIEHGWPTLSQALAIIDPTSSSVLGEIPMLANQLLTVFLGSSWSRPVITARWQSRKAEQSLSRARRRALTDIEARQGTQKQLEERISDLRAQVDALGAVPNYLDVDAATRDATQTAIVALAAQSELLDAALAYGTSERLLERTRADLHALMEAAATRRFWHSLRPSCCPRCDKSIEDDQWAREKEGHCSLCDSEFIEPADQSEVSPAVADSGDDHDDADGDGEDREDELVAIQEQVTMVEAQVQATSERHDQAKVAYDAAQATAAAAAATLSGLDRAASDERRALENELNVLLGRLEERSLIDEAIGTDGLADLQFVADVLKAALNIATDERDAEQKQLLAIVSAVITELGIEFGVRNLVRATLNAAGRVSAKKGETAHSFSELAPGERLRVRIALIVGLLKVGDQTGAGRHPGLLIIDDLTSHEIDHEDAAKIANRLTNQADLQVITASTYAPTLTEAIGEAGTVVTPADGMDVMF